VVAFYVRPWGGLGGVDPSHLWLHLQLAAGARLVHGAGGIALVMLLAWAARRSTHRRARVAVALSALVVAALGLALPGEALTLWAPSPGANLARPAAIDDRNGPFPELVGVNVRYDDAITVRLGWRLGPRAVARLWGAHALALPLAALATAGFRIRRRTRRPTSDGQAGG
jgi:hypothetical protein